MGKKIDEKDKKLIEKSEKESMGQLSLFYNVQDIFDSNKHSKNLQSWLR